MATLSRSAVIRGRAPLPCSWAKGCILNVVADLLGHATVTITVDRYSHVAMAMHQEGTDTLEAVLEDQHIS